MPRQTGRLCMGESRGQGGTIHSSACISRIYHNLRVFRSCGQHARAAAEGGDVFENQIQPLSSKVLIACQQGASRQYLQASDRPFRPPNPSSGILLTLLLHTRNGCSEGLGHSMRHLAGPFQTQLLRSREQLLKGVSLYDL